MTTPGIRFGAAYYYEYQPTPRLADDMRLMKEAGFTVIRVGESVWSTWEPEPGVFHLDWLEEVLDAALRSAGLSPHHVGVLSRRVRRGAAGAARAPDAALLLAG